MFLASRSTRNVRFKQARCGVAYSQRDRLRSRSERRPPRPDQLAGGKNDHAGDEEQKDRDRQVGLLLEFPKTFIDPRRSSKKDRAYEEVKRDGGGEEGYDFEDHRCVTAA